MLQFKDVTKLKTAVSRKLELFSKWNNNPDIPQEILDDINITALKTILSAINHPPLERAYTPLIKHWFKGPERIHTSLLANDAEIEYVHKVFDIIKKHYGDPVFDYYKQKTPEQYMAVDAWINFVKTMSPAVTPRANVRRFDNLQKFFTQSYYFKPDWTTMFKAVEYVMDRIGTKKVVPIDKKSINFKAWFEKQNSNVGWPYFANEKKTAPNGETWKLYCEKKTEEWINKYGTDWLRYTPAIIIGRDQPGGLNLEVTSDLILDHDVINKVMKSSRAWKESKARVVWAVPRVHNNAIAPIVKPVTEYLKDNSYFVGYLSKNDRKHHMVTMSKSLESLGLVSANLDYSSYDLTVPPELIILGAFILENLLDMNEYFTSVFWNAIYLFINTECIALNPTTGKLFSGIKHAGIPSGHMLTNLLGSIIGILINEYVSMRMYSVDEVIQINQKLMRSGSPTSTVMGDDLLRWFKSFSHLKEFAKIVKSEFNMDVSVDGVKTALGVFFLQERVVNDKVLYPTARAVSKCLWVERPKGLNWTLWDLGFASKINNMSQNPDIDDVVKYLMSIDATKLGLVSPDGVAMDPKSFKKAVAYESSKYDNKPIEMIYDGDPSKIDRFDIDTGMPSEDFITWWFQVLWKAAGKDLT